MEKYRGNIGGGENLQRDRIKESNKRKNQTLQHPSTDGERRKKKKLKVTG